ncbi:hypothetical protein [Motilimonas sp. KMU-193]|uniref:hypothetical protein n=1 Tax=Motilimonas sp. KMU-193 TaxID=3388668 RepID=UPI00396B0B71
MMLITLATHAVKISLFSDRLNALEKCKICPHLDVNLVQFHPVWERVGEVIEKIKSIFFLTESSIPTHFHIYRVALR